MKLVSTRSMLTLFLMTSVSGVFSQEQGEASSASGGQTAAVEVVKVTGQKIDRDLQQTVDSVSVLSGDELESLGVLDLRDAFRLVGNINYSPSGRGNNGFAIRGINSEGIGQAGGNSSPVSSLVIDGAVQSLEGVRKGARGVWDLESVEVLRGPQIAQGRNALAGVVNIKTKDPTPELEATARFTFDSQGEEQALAISGPLIGDQLMFRVAGEVHDKTLDIDYNEPQYEFLADEEFYTVRGKLLFEPHALPEFSAKLTWSRAYDDPAISAVTEPYFDRYLEQPTENIEGRINEVDNTILDLTYDFSDNLSLTSVSTLTETETKFETPSPNYDRNETREDTDISQDLRINYYSGSGDETGDLKVVAGVFYGRYKNEVDSLIHAYVPDVEVIVTEREVSVDSCVNLDMQADDGGRWYEYVSDGFYEIGQINFPFIISELPNYTPIPTSSGDVAFNQGGDWSGIGSLFVNTSGFTGVDNESLSIDTVDFRFEDYIANRDGANGGVAVSETPFIDSYGEIDGSIIYNEGVLQSIDATIDLSFDYDTFLGYYRHAGQLTLSSDNTFTLVAGLPYEGGGLTEVNSKGGVLSGATDPYAWDFTGTYSLSADQECGEIPTTATVTETSQRDVMVWSRVQDFLSHTKRINKAVYFESDWRFHRYIRLITGFRYEVETLDYEELNRLTSAQAYGDTKFEVFLPKVGLVFVLTDTQSVGFVITKGYRGGFIERTPGAVGQLKEVEPESLIDYELSYRAEWFNRQLVTNANIFYYDWEDQQVGIEDNSGPFPITQVSNSGKSEVRGAELTISAALVDGLAIGASIGYLETEFVEFEANGIDASGNEFPEAPAWSGAVVVDYAWLNGWFVGGDVSYQDGMYSKPDLSNANNYRVDERTLLNLRAGYEDMAGRYKITFGIDNAMDEDYLTGVSPSEGYIGSARVYSLTTQFWYN